MTDDEVREVQDRVNAAIWANLPVRKETMSYDSALAEGAMALFGEKYGDVVRVVNMGEWSKELCGGTHVDATGDIGLLLVVSETGIGSGVRRIEALAGAAAYSYVNDLRDRLDQLATALDTRADSVVVRAQQLTSQVRELERRIEALSRRLADAEAERLSHDAIPVDGLSVVAAQLSTDNGEYLRDVIDAVKSRLDRGVIVLAAEVKGTPQYKLSVTRGLTASGYHAGNLLKEAAQRAGFRGGGTPELGQGGGGESSSIPDVLQTVVELVRRKAETNG
jgi:alanyl-tRNA synthetase